MDDKKIKVGILFGGKSAEHEVSLISTKTVYKHIDKKKFNPVLIYINKKGAWNHISKKEFENNDFINKTYASFLPWENNTIDKLDIDIYFPVLHGPNCEDGKLQGLFELSENPYVGANSLASSIAMDKVISKILFKNAGLNTPDFLFFTKNDHLKIKDMILKKLGYPVFIKPCSLGSSVGISKVNEEKELKSAIDMAFKYDKKIIIEKAINAREIEIAVMGNDEIKISNPGELIPFNKFYDYEDKYVLGKTKFKIPTILSNELEKEIKKMAKKAYESLFLNGMARIDFFIEKNTEELFINEVNTIPGFTEISMFPKLWEYEGIGFTDLITKLIEYGFDYHRKQK